MRCEEEGERASASVDKFFPRREEDKKQSMPLSPSPPKGHKTAFFLISSCSRMQRRDTGFLALALLTVGVDAHGPALGHDEVAIGREHVKVVISAAAASGGGALDGLALALPVGGSDSGGSRSAALLLLCCHGGEGDKRREGKRREKEEKSETNRRRKKKLDVFFPLTLFFLSRSMATSSLFASRSLAAQVAPTRNQRCSCCNQTTRRAPTARRGIPKHAPAALPEHLAAAFDLSTSGTASWLAVLAATTTATASTPALPSPYVPSPYSPGPEIWLGALLPTMVFALGSYEFGKRLLIQRRCAVCTGTGLVEVPFNNSSSSFSSSSSSSPQQQQVRKVKCRACGGFFPWESAEKFFSAATRPGNGGPLQQPQWPKQTSVFYKVPSAEEAQRAAAEMREGKKSDGIAERDAERLVGRVSDKIYHTLSFL